MLEKFIDIYFTILFFCLKVFGVIMLFSLALIGLMIIYLVIKYYKKKK